MRLAISVIIASVVLSGCFESIRSEPPAPIVGASGSASGDGSEQTAAVTITPLQQSSAPAMRPQPGKAVQMLLDRSQAQQQSGELIAAAKSLERALGIEPQNAEVWNRLAHVRAEQLKYSMAAELAAKSNALAVPTDNDLKRDNWLLIAKMKRTQGLMAEARAAEQQADLIK
ncbi:MAG: hypothetical protein PVG66_07640 [Chromatiales bacterium]|jgi:Tfp pilus assembly protein PilF